MRDPLVDSAIGAVFDYVLERMPDRMRLVNVDGMVVDSVTDKYPLAGKPMFCLGSNFPTATEAGTGTRSYVEIGGQGAEEDFSIPFWTGCGVIGNQKLARDTALAVYDQVCQLIASDLTLGGVLREGRYAEIGPFEMTAPTITVTTGQSRWCVISSSIHCTNHYYPGAVS